MILKVKNCSGRWQRLILATTLLTLAGTGRAAITCTQTASLPGGLATLDVQPRSAYEAATHVFYATTLVPARNCSLGHCAGVRIDQLLKGDVDTDVVVVAYEDPESKTCPTLLTHKHRRHLFFAKKEVTKERGITVYRIGKANGAVAAKTLDDIETLQGRYLLYQAKLDQAIERHLKKP